MSNYSYTTNYLGKDSLPSGDTAKIIKGADFDNDFTAIPYGQLVFLDSSQLFLLK